MVVVDPSELDVLLEVQEHDTLLDRLRRQRDQLPQRERLVEIDSRRAGLEAESARLEEQRAEVQSVERRLDHEAEAVAARAAEVENTLYGGTVTSPRELQDLQADLDQLRSQQRHLEDRELDSMEQREQLEAEQARLEAVRSDVDVERASVEAELVAAEAEIDAEIGHQTEQRDALASKVTPSLLSDYEARRTRNRGIGIARMVGGSCQACGLAISAVEADEFRRAAPGTVCSPEECECILVPR